MTERFEGITPEGALVNTERLYARAWMRFAKALEERLDVRVIAFDPDIRIMDRKTQRITQLPMWLARRVLDLKK